MADKFKPGDIVQLKSGGPAMTVSELSSGGKYRCEWFKGASNELAHFSPDVLKPYEPPKND